MKDAMRLENFMSLLQTEGGFGAGMQQSSTGRLLALFQYAGRQYW